MTALVGLQVRNIDKLTAQWDDWVDAVERETADVANGLAVTFFQRVLLASPQYSGDFVGNWQYSINGVNTKFDPLPFIDQEGFSPFRTGSTPAILYAQRMNKGRDASYKPGDTFYVSNSAAHEEDYAVLIEDNRIKFRAEAGNAGAPMERVLASMSQYAELSASQVQTLKRKKL